MTAPVIVCDEYADFWRLIYAITHPETIEGYEEVDPDDTPEAARIVYASPHLVHHSALVEMERKQDEK
jgi:hypothetical protein